MDNKGYETLLTKNLVEEMKKEYGANFMKALLYSDIEEWRDKNKNGVLKLKALRSIIKEILDYERGECVSCKSPDLIAKHLVEYSFSPKEYFIALFLDNSLNLIKKEVISIGSQLEVTVSPNEILGKALRVGATSLVVAHNHPSGNPTPSGADVKVTKKIIKIGEVVGVPCYDHVIVYEGGYTSIRETHREIF